MSMKIIIRNCQRLIKIRTRKIRNDSLRLLESFGLDRAELGILLVNDARMKRINSRYREVSKTTDVLSFPIYGSPGEMPDDKDFLLGDIVINVRAAERQEAEYGLTFDREIRRLLIHGFLHLLGYHHETNRYQEAKMRRHEKEMENALEALD